MRSAMTLLIRFVMIFLGTLIAAGLLALGEPELAGQHREQGSGTHHPLQIAGQRAHAAAGAHQAR